MKKQTLKIAAIGMFIMTILIGTRNSALARHYNIPKNQTVTSTENGHPCTYTVTGWVDIEATWTFPFVRISHYDITLSGPCGTRRFQGMVSQDINGGYAWNTVVVDENNVAIPLSSIDDSIISETRQIIITEMANQYE